MQGRKQQGFTLLELLITFSVSAILIAVAAPSFRTTLLQNSRASVTNEIMAAAQLARSEAQKRGEDINLCGRTATGTTCLGTSDDWSAGVVVFFDVNDDGDFDAGDTELYYAGPLKDNMNVSSNRAVYSFRPFSQLALGGTLKICDQDNSIASRDVVIPASGRAYIQEGSCP